MTYQEVYEIISNTEGKSSNVWITSNESGKRYKMNLHISSANILKIKTPTTRGEGYNVTNVSADKWKSVELCKKVKRNKNKGTGKM